MKRIFVVFAIMMFLASIILTGCGGSKGKKSTEPGADKGSDKKVAVIFGTGGLGDQSYNDLVFKGMKDAESKLGVKFDYAEPNAIADIEVNLREMANEGQYAVIISVGFEPADVLTKIADEFPEQKFAIIDATVDKPNVASFLSKEEEGSFLVGVLAGLMKLEPTKYGISDKQILGFVGGVDIPIIRKFQAGFMAGAQYVNPNIKVQDDFVGGFSDVTTAKEIALTMNGKGADIIYHAAGGAGMGVFQAAKQNDFLAIGVNSNQNSIDPDHIMASMLKRVDTAAFKIVKETIDGTLVTGKITELGLKDEGIGYTVEGSNVKVSDDLIKQVEDLKQKVIKGEIKLPLTVNEVDAFLKQYSKK